MKEYIFSDCGGLVRSKLSDVFQTSLPICEGKISVAQWMEIPHIALIFVNVAHIHPSLPHGDQVNLQFEFVISIMKFVIFVVHPFFKLYLYPLFLSKKLKTQDDNVSKNKQLN